MVSLTALSPNYMFRLPNAVLSSVYTGRKSGLVSTNTRLDTFFFKR